MTREPARLRLVVAIGGNALLRRGQAPSAENQLDNIRRAATQLARLASNYELVLTHGNGPQVGLLALQAAAAAAVDGAVAAYPLDVLGAQTDGMIGYLLEQELANRLPASHTVATLLTRVEVDARDPAFEHPTKPIGPVYSTDEGQHVAAARGWPMAVDGAGLRRVVASPRPLRVLGLAPIRWLLERGALVIAAGGGGIPVARGADGLHGVDAVIDKDLCTGLLARELQADCLVIATDVAAVYLDWGQSGQRPLRKVTPQALARHAFPAGSMGPKVEAASAFVLATGKRALIGSLDEIESMLEGRAGTEVCTATAGGSDVA
jgi:carbamate kinase